ELKTFINNFDELEYFVKINLYNCFKFICENKNINDIKNEIVEYVNSHNKLISKQINCINLDKITVPFDNLFLFSLYSIHNCFKKQVIFEYLNNINENKLDKEIVDILINYFRNYELEFIIYETQNEINNELIKPLFKKSKSSFKLNFGVFSNMFNKKISTHRLKSMLEIEKYVLENKNKSYLLSMENNTKEIYKIVQNHSFVSHFLSPNTIKNAKKYLLSKNYWMNIFKILIDSLPFDIPEDDKEISIKYDESNFKIVEISSKIINFSGSIQKSIENLISNKNINSKGIDIQKTLEIFVLDNIIDIGNFIKIYKFNNSKLVNCSYKVLDKIKILNNKFESEVNLEITNKKITNKLEEINWLSTTKLNFLEHSLIVGNKNDIDIFSTARSVRTFIELVSKMFIIDQIFKCYKEGINNKYPKRIEEVSKILDVDLSIRLLEFSINTNHKNLENVREKIDANKRSLEILHLKYHLFKFDRKFHFPEFRFSFTEEVYENFIKKLVKIFDNEILNIFAHSFHWLHNSVEIDELTDEFINGLKNLINLLKSDLYNDFIYQLNSIYEFVSNKDNSLEKFFNTKK
ncbi:hypothetical protein, partial [Mycoplasmopsis anatis]